MFNGLSEASWESSTMLRPFTNQNYINPNELGFGIILFSRNSFI